MNLLSLAIESHASSTLFPYPTNGPSTTGVRLYLTVSYFTMGATGAVIVSFEDMLQPEDMTYNMMSTPR